MTTLIPFTNNYLSPINSMAPMFREIDRLFNFFEPSPKSSYLSQNYILDEDEKEYKVSLAMPGVNKSNIKINYLKGKLSVSYENKEESKSDFKYSSFSKSWKLPDNVDDAKIDASYTDGILKIIIPKTEPEQPKLIEVK